MLHKYYEIVKKMLILIYSSVETTLSAASQPDRSQRTRPDSVEDLSASIY